MSEVMTMEEFENLSDEEQEQYRNGASYDAKIQCGRCGRISEVGGHIWKTRLRRSKTEVVKDERTGVAVAVYVGWNCDRCADIIEGVGYGYGGDEY